jgi:dihydroorotate dehydrogenase (fumarate)
MGLALENPLVVASSSLGKSADGVRRCAEAGAGAVVLKSLFEEQIWAEIEQEGQYTGALWHTEAVEYVERMGIALGPTQYLKLIEEAKRAVRLPVIASLNCTSSDVWVEYAQRIASAGADAIELNIAVMPSDPKRRGEEIEEIYYRVVERVRESARVPVAVKIGPHFTSVANVARQLYLRGAAALVLFNRFYQLDIDIDTVALAPGYRFSSPQEMSGPLRWVSLLAGRVEIDLAASTGVHDGPGAVKQLLAGATVVQLCSTLYLNGLARIEEIVRFIDEWMNKHGFESIASFRGLLSQEKSGKPELYERLQYIKALVGIE